MKIQYTTRCNYDPVQPNKKFFLNLYLKKKIRNTNIHLNTYDSVWLFLTSHPDHAIGRHAILPALCPAAPAPLPGASGHRSLIHTINGIHSGQRQEVSDKHTGLPFTGLSGDAETYDRSSCPRLPHEDESKQAVEDKPAYRLGECPDQGETWLRSARETKSAQKGSTIMT